MLKFFLLLQYRWDKAFHFPGKFHFLVKTITDSDRLGLVYLNLAFSTANGPWFLDPRSSILDPDFPLNLELFAH